VGSASIGIEIRPKLALRWRCLRRLARLQAGSNAMIYYASHPGHSYTIGVVVLYYGRAIESQFRLVPYGKLHTLRDAAPGAVLWTDFDRLDEAELAQAGTLRAELKAKRPDLQHLNDPLASEQRFDLLRRLHREGSNAFAVRRPAESLDGLRYPVFLRDEVGASYAAPPLLEDRAALERALSHLPRSGMARPMIVEFGAKAGPDGLYRKYGAFRIGERIVPQHCFIQAQWFIKHAALTPATRLEHRAYLEANPHAAELRRLFDAARIDYGRIDYTVVDGRIQVFEINTNPTILSDPPTPWQPYDQRPYARDYVEAILALPQAGIVGAQDELDRRHRRELRRLRRSLGRKQRQLAWERARRRFFGR